MSKIDQKSGFIFLPKGRLDKYTEAIIETMFDQTVDADEHEIYMQLNQANQLKKLSLAKILLFPFEFLTYRIFAGKEFSSQIKKEQHLYWKFLAKKITVEQFKTELLSINKGY